MKPTHFPPVPSWRVNVPRSWFKQATLAELREVIDTFDMMLEGIGQTRGIVNVSGQGDIPAWAHQFVENQ